MSSLRLSGLVACWRLAIVASHRTGNTQEREMATAVAGKTRIALSCERAPSQSAMEILGFRVLNVSNISMSAERGGTCLNSIGNPGMQGA